MIYSNYRKRSSQFDAQLPLSEVNLIEMDEAPIDNNIEGPVDEIESRLFIITKSQLSQITIT